MKRRWAPGFLILALAGILLAEAGDGNWLRKVPSKDRARPNPFASDPDAPAAGAKIFAPTCTLTASNRPRPASYSGFSPTAA
jgi:hypothetical protein